MSRHRFWRTVSASGAPGWRARQAGTGVSRIPCLGPHEAQPLLATPLIRKKGGRATCKGQRQAYRAWCGPAADWSAGRWVSGDLMMTSTGFSARVAGRCDDVVSRTAPKTREPMNNALAVRSQLGCHTGGNESPAFLPPTPPTLASILS